MKIFLWIAAGLFVCTALPAALFFALHVSTGEPVPLARATERSSSGVIGFRRGGLKHHCQALKDQHAKEAQCGD